MNAGGTRPRNHPWSWPVLLVLAVAVLPLWGLQRDFNDGVIAEWAYVTGQWAGVAEWLLPSNWWGHYALYRVAGFLGSASGVPTWVWIKLWMTAVVAGLAHEAFRFAQLYGYGQRGALAAAALAASFPAWAVLYSSGVMHIGFAWLAFFGHRWLFWHGGWRRAAGFALVLLSFQVNANLVLQPVLAALACWLQRTGAAGMPRNRLVAVLAAAIAYYAWFSLVHPPQGEYEGYNQLLLPTSIANIVKIASTAALFASWGVLLLPAALLAALWRGPEPAAAQAAPARSAWERMAVAALLTAAAVFPYAMVGKGPPLFLIGPPVGESIIWRVYAATGDSFHLTLNAFTLRQAALMAVPFALMGVALVELLTLRRRSAAAFTAGVSAAVLTQIGVLLLGHLSKWEQAHWDQSVVEALKRMPPPPEGRVEIALTPTRPYMHHIFESNHLLWQAWKRTAWAGVVYYAGDPYWEQRMRAILPHQAQLLQEGRAMHQYLLMADYRGNRTGCVTRISAAPSTPQLPPWQWLAQVATRTVVAAEVRGMETHCGQSVFTSQP